MGSPIGHDSSSTLRCRVVLTSTRIVALMCVGSSPQCLMTSDSSASGKEGMVAAPVNSPVNMGVIELQLSEIYDVIECDAMFWEQEVGGSNPPAPTIIITATPRGCGFSLMPINQQVMLPAAIKRNISANEIIFRKQLDNKILYHTLQTNAIMFQWSHCISPLYIDEPKPRIAGNRVVCALSSPMEARAGVVLPRKDAT